MLKNSPINTNMNKQCGFTLIELLVAMAILSIAIAIAVPSFNSFTSSNKQVVAINQLTGAFSLARSEAVTRNARMTLSATGGNWAQGWTLTATTSGTQVRVGPAIPTTVTVTNTGPTSVEFNSDGTLRTNISTTGFSITLCDSQRANSKERVISLIASGKYSVTEGNNCP